MAAKNGDPLKQRLFLSLLREPHSKVHPDPILALAHPPDIKPSAAHLLTRFLRLHYLTDPQNAPKSTKLYDCEIALYEYSNL
jgi:hypothetical protein